MKKEAEREKQLTNQWMDPPREDFEPTKAEWLREIGVGRLLQRALDYLPLGITVKDMQGKVVYTNFAEGEMHGYRVEEIISREARMLAPQRLWQPLICEKIKDSQMWKRESLNLRKSGEEFPVLLTSSIIRDSNGMPVGIVTVSEDITDRKRTEEALKKTEKELKKRDKDLQEIYEIEVNRELRMRDLRRQVEELKQRLGEEL